MIDQSKPFVRLCSNCQHEFPEVEKQVQAHTRDYNFSHGICPRHSYQMLIGMGKSPEEAKAFVEKMGQKSQPMPDLKERPDLVKLYSQGIFTQEDLAKAKQEKAALTERLQRLAGIIRD